MTRAELIRAIAETGGLEDEMQIRVVGVRPTQKVELYGCYYGTYDFEVDIDAPGEIYEIDGRRVVIELAKD